MAVSNERLQLNEKGDKNSLLSTALIMGTTRTKHDFPDCDKAHRRRRLINDKCNVAIEDGITMITEYVEGPRGNIISTKCFIPSRSVLVDSSIDKPKGLICQCMGYTDHSDWSRILIAQEYCKRGYVYFVWDHLGHGRSSGLWIDIDNLQDLCDDAVFICNYAQSKYPFENNYLLGRSMGGNIVTRILIQIQSDTEKHPHRDFISPKRWNGILLFSPMVAVDQSHIYHPALMYIFENWLAYYLPKTTLLPKTIGADWTTLSRDKEMALFMAKDPLSFPYGPRFKTGMELLKSVRFVQESSDIIAKVPIPLLVLHGSGDTVTTHTGSEKMIKSISQSQSPRTLKRRISRTHWLIEGGVHSLLMDAGREDVMEQTLQWMERHNR